VRHVVQAIRQQSFLIESSNSSLQILDGFQKGDLNAASPDRQLSEIHQRPASMRQR
jgi:hypothetical protein